MCAPFPLFWWRSVCEWHRFHSLYNYACDNIFFYDTSNGPASILPICEYGVGRCWYSRIRVIRLASWHMIYSIEHTVRPTNVYIYVAHDLPVRMMAVLWWWWKKLRNRILLSLSTVRRAHGENSCNFSRIAHTTSTWNYYWHNRRNKNRTKMYLGVASACMRQRRYCGTFYGIV